MNGKRKEEEQRRRSKGEEREKREQRGEKGRKRGEGRGGVEEEIKKSISKYPILIK